MGTFDLENKVTFNELAPSLQAMLNDNEFGIAFIHMLKTAKHGQDIKIDALNRALIGDDNFHRCRLCADDDEFKVIKSYGPTPQDLLDNWKYYINGVEQTVKPIHNTTNRYISMNSNRSKILYKSNITYPFVDVWIKITCTNTSFNKEAGILVSEYTLDGVTYDLCIVRTRNKISLVFNYLNHTNKNPACNIASISTTDVDWANKSCHITFKKEYNRITFGCNDIGGNSLEQVYKFVYNYPNTYDKGNVPYTRKIYKTALRELMRKDSTIGYTAKEFNGNFSILDQNGLYDDDKLYHLSHYVVYMWDGTNVVARPDGFNCLMSRCFIFNPITEHLYWFKYISHFYDMTPTGAGFSDGIDTKSMAGQVIKVHDGGNPPESDPAASPMFSDDNFYNLKVTDNDFELAEMMSQKGISMAEIFYEWERFTFFTNYTPLKSLVWAYNGGQDYGVGGWGGNVFRYNDPAELPYANAWSYSAANQTIYNNGNTYPITGFRSNKSYVEYWIEYTVRCNDALHAGTDYIGSVVSWMFDNNGDPHWLSIVRTSESLHKPKGANNKYATADQIGFALVYDLYLPTQVILLDITRDIIDFETLNNKFCNWQGAGQLCTFFTGKTATRISAKTTNYAPKPNDPGEDWDYQFDWDLPDTKPADWSDEMWKNINTMMESGPIGLWAMSYSTNFGIKKQYEVFDDADIYALHINKVYTQTDNEVDATKEVYIWKDQETYGVSNIQVRILLNNSTEIYTQATGSVNFKVIAYKKNLGGGMISPQTYVKLTANGADVPNSEGLLNETAYYIQYFQDGSWIWPGSSSPTKNPEWVVKGSCTDILPKRVWLFNTSTEKLYYYGNDSTDYTRIHAE